MNWAYLISDLNKSLLQTEKHNEIDLESAFLRDINKFIGLFE